MKRSRLKDPIDMSKVNYDAQKVIIKKCHICGHLNCTSKEIEKCPKCGKSFLPSSYFTKIHCTSSREFKELFARADEISEEDLVKGIHVIW